MPHTYKRARAPESRRKKAKERYSAQKACNESAKRERRKRHAIRRRRLERERRRAEAFDSHGRSGVNVCGRKIRYNTFHDAYAASRRVSRETGKAFYVYKCPLGQCDGWHLTTHPRDGRVERAPFLKPSEVLENSRRASLRIREIDAELEILDERIGVQGHGYEFHGKSDVLDPMRKVIDKLSQTEELQYERAELWRDVVSAWKIVAGISKYHENGDEAADLIVAYYIEAKGMPDIRRDTGFGEQANKWAIEQIVDWCDRQGCANLYRAVYERDEDER